MNNPLSLRRLRKDCLPGFGSEPLGNGNHDNLSAFRWNPNEFCASSWHPDRREGFLGSAGEAPGVAYPARGDPFAEVSGPRFVKLSRSEMVSEYADADVRGRAVLTIDDHWIGIIDDVLIDIVDHRVCFLEVRTDGFRGLGGRVSL